MDPALLSAAAAIAGSLVGATSSVVTTLLTQRGQARVQALRQEVTERTALYSEFIAEASKRLGEGIGLETESVEVVVGLHAIVGRMRLVSSREVVRAAERLVRLIVVTYGSPNQTLSELRENLLREENKDPLEEFGEACRAELKALRG